jgi:hypothetical protein
LCVYGVQKCGYSEVRKRREGRAQYEPIRKVNRYKQNCPVEDNLDNKGMTKWDCEKMPFCTVHHLKVYLINSITTANSARSKKSMVTPRSITTCQVVTAVGHSREPAASNISMLVRFVTGCTEQNKVLHLNILFEK